MSGSSPWMAVNKNNFANRADLRRRSLYLSEPTGSPAITGWRGFCRPQDQQVEDIVKSRAKNEKKVKATAGFSEPLFCIKGRAVRKGKEDKTWAVIAGASAAQALERVERLRRELPGLPRREQLRAEFLRSGPVQDAPFYAGGYFSFLDDVLEQFDAGELVCPFCGR